MWIIIIINVILVVALGSTVWLVNEGIMERSKLLSSLTNRENTIASYVYQVDHLERQIRIMSPRPSMEIYASFNEDMKNINSQAEDILYKLYQASERDPKLNVREALRSLRKRQVKNVRKT